MSEIYGIYELTEIESYEDGKRTSERANAGMVTFTRKNQMSVVSGSNEWVMAYFGNFRIQGDSLNIDVKSCVVRELEGKTITRKILRLGPETLVIESGSTVSDKTAKLTWKKTFAL
ncbi:MAG: hypothetical protein KDD25_07940 [Bdellovibrionales bacterium]|nr:hypothetical protein [Bdellovibrionales bacterium]